MSSLKETFSRDIITRIQTGNQDGREWSRKRTRQLSRNEVVGVTKAGCRTAAYNPATPERKPHRRWLPLN
jgi:hypothetical protein